MLGGIEQLAREVFETFLRRRQIATFEITRVVDQNMRIAGVAANRGEGCSDGVLAGEIELDHHASAPLIPQRMPTGRSLSSTARPWINLVLRPSDCHFEVAPTTTATGLPLIFLPRFSPILNAPFYRDVRQDNSNPVTQRLIQFRLVVVSRSSENAFVSGAGLRRYSALSL